MSGPEVGLISDRGEAVRVPPTGTMDNLLIHATGVCALALNIAALVHPCERSLRLQSGLSGLLWALNNLLLGAHAAAALSVLSASRTATSAYSLRGSDAFRLKAFGAFSLAALGIGAVTWNGWPSALLVAASLLSTYALFYLRGRELRLSMLGVSALWMHNAWSCGSWEQIVANAATAAAALYGAWGAGRGTSASTTNRSQVGATGAMGA